MVQMQWIFSMEEVTVYRELSFGRSNIITCYYASYLKIKKVCSR